MDQGPTKRLKVLYAIQGTGNGHIARAATLIPEFRKYAEVDALLSGIQVDLKTPFEVKYRLKGLSFIFGKHGGIDTRRMLKEVSLSNFLREVRQIDLSGYDFVINDFEPVTAWACRKRKIPILQVSHQFGVNQPEAPLPKGGWLGKLILKYYAPGKMGFGFHFKPYNNRTFTPIIRDEVRQLQPTNSGHVTVYLPAYDDAHLISVLKHISGFTWQVFSKHTKESYQKGDITIHPVNNEGFIKSMTSAYAVLCGAGFETPAEVLYLGKKVMVIPMKGQYEQHCNARSAEDVGVKKIMELDANAVPVIQQWLDSDVQLHVEYPDNKNEVVKTVLEFANRQFFQNRFVLDF